FTSTVLPHEGIDFAFANLDVDILQGSEPIRVGLAYMMKFYNWSLYLIRRALKDRLLSYTLAGA
ncbi:MAG TPA: hypothetical protein PLG17_06780, partial [Thermodesulfobacteriota bacterium]|nr:hypothetical protein [Thermodesulfobacteriota bacterium]